MPDNKSPRTTCLVLTSLALLACGLFTAPNPTPAPTLIQPTDTLAPPTNTPTQLPPPATLPPPSPRPTITPTPAPEWVIDFAEPILAEISNRPPNIEDDFEQSSENWLQVSTYHDISPSKGYKYENGKLLVTDWPAYYRGVRFTDDYVAEVDVQSLPGLRAWSLGFGFRSNGSCSFMVTHDSQMEAVCRRVQDGIPSHWLRLPIENVGDSRTVRLRLIVKGNRFAFYVDGKPMGYFEHEYFETDHAWLQSYPSYGAFDNFKFWDISGLKIP
ncbi:MAG: hypothetical protein KGZ88_15245 [Methylomicrobium sp.]|nr:hypothetical protein [Methylomicrobium sp.]